MEFKYLIGPGLSLLTVVGGLAVMWGVMKKTVQANERAIEAKVDHAIFKAHCREMEKELKRGDEKFDQIMTELRKQGQLLARIDERTHRVAEKNGVH